MDKDAITPDVVRCLLREQFPRWAGLPVAAVDLDGWDNTTFRLGDSLSARLPSADGYVPQVDKEHRWLPVLAPRLPLPVPRPLARGRPGCGYPRPWSVYGWLPGEPASSGGVTDFPRLARDLGAFLAALQRADASTGPPAGAHSAWRGGPLSTYDREARSAIADLAGEVDAAAAAAVWEAALAAEWSGAPVWVHGDVAPSNLLVEGGALGAVIDFGCLAVGDPACDLAIAWTLFEGPSRTAFAAAVPADEGAWRRGRGWALWKALVTRREERDGPGSGMPAAVRFGWRHDALGTVRAVLDDPLM